jgi:hypothetical protein
MSSPTEKQAVDHVAELIHEWFEKTHIRTKRHAVVDTSPIDVVIEIGENAFACEYKQSSDAASVAMAIDQIREITHQESALIPLVLVPYMGEVGAQRCREAEVSWIDLSGNAHVETDSLYIHVEGKPNQFKKSGRPSNTFAPKSSRIARFLLMNPGEYFRQAEIADATKVGRGYTSKIVRRLREKALVTEIDGKVGTKRPGLLLDAWREKYDFNNHRIIKGTVATRESQTLTTRLARTFENAGLKYAVTGLSAAWILTSFARYRITTIYLDEDPDDALKREIGLREDPTGANVWLVIPNDDGVFQGVDRRTANEQNPIKCVHPVQVYLDLSGHPERSSEAASEVRRQYLRWAKS